MFRHQKSYSVGSSQYVVRIKLLDTTTLDFNLRPNDTGEDCLNRVTQVLELQESCFFGLRYKNKHGHMRWINLAENMRKQLDKDSLSGARDSEVIFGVRFFPSNVLVMQQELTRFLFFLQLKFLVMEGQLTCSRDQAVLLASHAVQAEFGDHDSDKHTVDFYGEYILFPPSLEPVGEKEKLQALREMNEGIMKNHRKHRGTPPASAEMAYIRIAQQLPEYGYESLSARDQDGQTVEIGACFVGVFVKQSNMLPKRYFRWPDIQEMKWRKRSMELSTAEETMIFDVEDKQSARYTWEALIAQHKFHRMQTAGGKTLPNVSNLYRPHMDRGSRGGTPQGSFVRKKTLSKSSSIMELSESQLSHVGTASSSMEMSKIRSSGVSIDKVDESETSFSRGHNGTAARDDDEKRLSPSEGKPRPQSSSALKDLEVKPVPLNRPQSLSHNLRGMEMKSEMKPASAVGFVTGVSNGEVGMATADTDDELMNELEQDDDSQRKLDEALEREALSSDRAALYEALHARLNCKDYLEEYDSVPKKHPDVPMAVLSESDARTKNRFKDILPYEETRVKLDIEESRTESDYINASYVSMTIGSEKFQYIASQGPLAGTAVDFWQMVWESKANLIVMVTSEVENGRVKCYHYWPPDDEPNGSILHGKFTVTGQYCNDSGSTVTRGFHLRHPSEEEPRVVWQLQFIGWPDHGIPEDPETFLNFIDEIGGLRRHANSTSYNKLNPPTIVHCSAGVGRTGVTILMELLLTAIHQNAPISIRRFLKHLRSQRMALVQTPGQYRFIYQALLSFLQRSKSNRLI